MYCAVFYILARVQDDELDNKVAHVSPKLKKPMAGHTGSYSMTALTPEFVFSHSEFGYFHYGCLGIEHGPSPLGIRIELWRMFMLTPNADPRFKVDRIINDEPADLVHPQWCRLRVSPTLNFRGIIHRLSVLFELCDWVSMNVQQIFVIIASAYLAAATPTLLYEPASTCSGTGPIQCNHSVEPASSTSPTAILFLLGTVLQDLGSEVGLDCGLITVIGAGGSS
ncbi:hypothetical protein F5050DRAFT_1711776 [Lentinula boryana]|uniref:Uncharacterized protein n=1 Tax=Lentinula boryana TaxID=40481 RepID=A0ABQ8QE13_9AGAR|nr:hypothetical protein F5050DRAFT_1711776 [Lentinula boryana]